MNRSPDREPGKEKVDSILPVGRSESIDQPKLADQFPSIPFDRLLPAPFVPLALSAPEPAPVIPPPTPVLEGNLSFGRALWTLGIGIFVTHLSSVIIWILDDSHTEFLLEESYRSYFFTGIAEYVLLLCAALWDIDSKGISFRSLFRGPVKGTKKAYLTMLKFYSWILPVLWLLSYLPDSSPLEAPYFGPDLQLLYALTLVVVAPVFEELLFRSYLYGAMLARFKRRRERLVINAMLFATAHITVIEFVLGGSVPPYIFAVGFMLAYLYEEHRSVVPCIILHALNNGTVLALEYINL